jgi:acylphosphatase
MQTESSVAEPMAAQSFLFEGQLNGRSYAEFARHRAARLDLALVIQALTDRAMRLSVDGEPDLIDMFEMAMSLGPQDCIVRDVIRLREKTA